MGTEWSDQPYPAGLAGDSSVFVRRYLDVSGRPLAGKVVITGDSWTTVGNDIVPPSSVPVYLDPNGTVTVTLPPGVYDVSERLVSPEGQQINREWQLTHT